MLKHNCLLAFVIFLLTAITAVAFPQEDTSKVRELLNSTNDKTKSFEEIIKITEKAIILSEKIDYMQGKADALNINGRANLKVGKYPEAMRAFLEELMLRTNNPGWENSSIGKVYNLIGESYRAVANFEMAIENLNKGLKFNREKNDEREIAHSYNRLSAVYFEIMSRDKDINAGEKAEEFSMRSIDISKRIHEQELIINSYNIIGAINTSRKNYDDALKYFFLALDEIGNDTTYSDKPNILNNIASVYNRRKDYRKAIDYGLQSHKISKKSGIKIYTLFAAEVLSNSYANIGDYKEAYIYMFEVYSDYLELFDERKSAEIYGLQKKFENELTVQEESIKSTKRFIIGVAFITIIVIVGIVIFAKHKQQDLLNKELENKNKFISFQKEELEQSNAAKDKFFSILSHDIKNPLNGILLFSKELNSEFNEIIDEEKKEYIEHIKTSSESLFKLIDKVLAWSRVQTKKINVVPEKIDLYETLLHTVELQKVNSLRKNIVIENNIPKGINVVADKNILETVLRNLVDNSVKFTKAGGKITVSTEVRDKIVNISVTDTGVGMSKPHLEKLFLIDRKNSSLGTNSEEGTGLGLILCKEMLELMGVTLKVESEEEKGSRFFFELPLDNSGSHFKLI